MNINAKLISRGMESIKKIEILPLWHVWKKNIGWNELKMINEEWNQRMKAGMMDEGAVRLLHRAWADEPIYRMSWVSLSIQFQFFSQLTRASISVDYWFSVLMIMQLQFLY